MGSNRNGNFIISTQDNIANNTSNNNVSYVIPVNMKLSNNNTSNSNNANNLNYRNNPAYNLSQSQQMTNTNDLSEQSGSKVNSNAGNILIKTTRQPNRIEDEVDLLKDLLIKNLNASNDPNFFGICTKCKEKIIGAENGLKAMDNLFHVNCFACHGCGR